MHNWRWSVLIVLGALLVATLAVGPARVMPQEKEQDHVKTKLHDLMEEFEHHFDVVKESHSNPATYPKLVAVARKMQVLMERIIAEAPASLKALEKAGTRADQMEAKSLFVEAWAHTFGLEAAFLRADAEQVNTRFRRLRKLRSTGHEKFQP